MYSKFEDVLPEEVWQQIPMEIEETALFGIVVFSYKELVRADKLGMIKYYYDESKGFMRIKQGNYYKRKEQLENTFASLDGALTSESKLVLPRHPEEIAKKIYTSLAGYNHVYKTNLITVDVIKATMKAITGRERLPTFNDEEKMMNLFLSFEIIEEK